VRQTTRAIVCYALHSLVHLSVYISTVAIAASSAVGHVIVALATAARPVKAVLSVQLEGQNVGQSQAVTVGWESLHKEQRTLHSTATAYHAGFGDAVRCTFQCQVQSKSQPMHTVCKRLDRHMRLHTVYVVTQQCSCGQMHTERGKKRSEIFPSGFCFRFV